MAANPVTPIQAMQFTAKDFTENPGLINTYLTSLVNQLNTLSGASGPTVLPAGVDVAGGTISGLAAPQGPTDAVSSAHAASTYSAAAVGPQLDIGGKFTLKGLAILWLNARKFADAEVPKGTIDGVNTNFTLANSPNPPLSLNLFLSKLRADQGVDYTLKGASIVFAVAPAIGASLIANYRY